MEQPRSFEKPEQRLPSNLEEVIEEKDKEKRRESILTLAQWGKLKHQIELNPYGGKLLLSDLLNLLEGGDIKNEVKIEILSSLYVLIPFFKTKEEIQGILSQVLIFLNQKVQSDLDLKLKLHALSILIKLLEENKIPLNEEIKAILKNLKTEANSYASSSYARQIKDLLNILERNQNNLDELSTS